MFDKGNPDFRSQCIESSYQECSEIALCDVKVSFLFCAYSFWLYISIFQVQSHREQETIQGNKQKSLVQVLAAHK